MIPQVKQTEKRCNCGALMELRFGSDHVAFWVCVKDRNHREALGK